VNEKKRIAQFQNMKNIGVQVHDYCVHWADLSKVNFSLKIGLGCVDGLLST